MRAMATAAALALLAACPRPVAPPDGPGGGGSGSGEGGDGVDDAVASPPPPPEEDAEGAVAEGDAEVASRRRARAKRDGDPDAVDLPGIDTTARERREAMAPHVRTGEHRLAAGDLDAALEAARDALAIDPDQPDAILLYARIHLARGWLDKAVAVLEAATRRAGVERSAKVWMMLGLALELRGDDGDPAAAIAAYTRATALAPRYARAWANLGAAQIDARAYGEAIAALEVALRLAPESLGALTNLGIALRHQAETASDASEAHGTIRRAAEAHETAIELDASFAPAYLNLGVLYLDVPSFPGMSELQRLRTAIELLREYQVLGGADPPGGTVDEYLATAQRRLQKLARSDRSYK